MSSRFRYAAAGILLLLALGIHIYSLNAARVEWQYSMGFFPGFAATLRKVFGGFSTSIGDIVYGLFIVFLLYKLFRFFRWVFRKKRTKVKKDWPASAASFLIWLAGLYIIFNIFWGINYDRKGIAWQLGLDLVPYQVEDVKSLNAALVQKVNENRRMLPELHPAYASDKELFRQATSAYGEAAKQYPFLKYQPVSLKKSIWGWVGNYTGFTGYYNPFTGEAQVNTTVPGFLHPFVACHEVAHQLGYAKEMEANFVGFLAGRSSQNRLMLYSLYLDLFMYANRNLSFTDSLAARTLRNGLDTAVVNDLKTWKKFNLEHKSFAEPIVRFLYGTFLKSNGQPQGILSYDEVTAFLIAYRKKFGTL
ncbi:MAG: DUF3810 domain-containing protein [Ferruginibacter sp.]